MSTTIRYVTSNVSENVASNVSVRKRHPQNEVIRETHTQKWGRQGLGLEQVDEIRPNEIRPGYERETREEKRETEEEESTEGQS